MDGYRAWHADDVDRAMRFTGNWKDYLPIAATNVLLIIVTLGIYRFWAKARERRYLWSRTHFIDDQFEWTGTGKEMFVGFLFVVAIETKQNRALVERVFTDRFQKGFADVAGWFVRDAEERDNLANLLRTVVWAISWTAVSFQSSW